MFSASIQLVQQKVKVLVTTRGVRLKLYLQLPHRFHTLQHSLLLVHIRNFEVPKTINNLLYKGPLLLIDVNLALVLDVVVVGRVVDYVQLFGIANLALEGRRGMELLHFSHNVGVD